MRVAESLNEALHGLLADDPGVYLIGEDLLDPYGGAFKVARGLSSRFPDRVLSTPISEGGIVGVGGGLALSGDKAIVEIMFSDFVTLAFDQIVNFAAKSVSMYGRRVAVPLVVRCPTGGGRGYGPTHSQSLQKHFVGIPGLSLFEVAPFDGHRDLFDTMLALEEPCVLFEDKVLYGRRTFTGGIVDELLRYATADGFTRVSFDDPEDCDCVLIVPGGLTHRALDAVRALLVEDEISCLLLVPRRLYPFDAETVAGLLGRAGTVVVAEDGTGGGTWGSEVAHRLHEIAWERLRRPVALVHAADSVVPTAGHLEQEVLVQDTDIRRAVREALRD
ncbi:alpha-ketoacid dehydrogenase subunit beta [Actinocorallia longicatena]|uniref:Transketolase C-terminal domain-containing protein n=1 Tax=Actinocorallia longicatena TaxID=111803 RepID=A0ABP6PZD1_9ACTN